MKISTADLKGIVIFHNIIVAGFTITEHNVRFSKLLNVLSDAGLKVKLKEYKFLQKSIIYLVHRLDDNGLYTLTKHTVAIKRATVSENEKFLNHF